MTSACYLLFYWHLMLPPIYGFARTNERTSVQPIKCIFALSFNTICYCSFGFFKSDFKFDFSLQFKKRPSNLIFKIAIFMTNVVDVHDGNDVAIYFKSVLPKMFFSKLMPWLNVIVKCFR